MSYEEQIRQLSDKIMEDFDSMWAVFNEKVEEYLAIDVPQKKAEMVAFKQLKGSYQAALRSKAIPMEGFVVGLTKIVDRSNREYREAMKVLEDLKQENLSAWINIGMNRGICDAEGNPLYCPENTSEKQKWLWKQKIPEHRWERSAFGYFRPIIKEDGVQVNNALKPGVIYIRETEKHVLVPGSAYRFRAGCSAPEATVLSISTATQTEFEETGKVSYDVVMKMVKEFGNLAPFIDVYNPNSDNKIEMPEGVKFYATEATVVSLTAKPENSNDSVEFQSLMDDDVDQNIRMTVVREMDTCFENAIGLVIYRPYMTKPDEEKGREAEPSGEIVGFIPDPTMCIPPKEVKQVSASDFD